MTSWGDRRPNAQPSDVGPSRYVASVRARSVSAAVNFGVQPSSDLALPVSITMDVRKRCSGSNADGRNGSRVSAADATFAVAEGTRTGRAPKLLATSDSEMSSSPAML